MTSTRLTEDVITFTKTLEINQYLASDLYIRKEKQGRILKGFPMFYRIRMAMFTKKKKIHREQWD